MRSITRKIKIFLKQNHKMKFSPLPYCTYICRLQIVLLSLCSLPTKLLCLSETTASVATKVLMTSSISSPWALSDFYVTRLSVLWKICKHPSNLLDVWANLMVKKISASSLLIILSTVYGFNPFPLFSPAWKILKR